MLKSILAAAVVVGVAGGAVQAKAANAQAALPGLSQSAGNGQNQPKLAQPIYWTRDAYGRPIWIPGRPYYAPPVGYYRPWHHHRWWDGRGWRWR